jgi:hypothetical protein
VLATGERFGARASHSPKELALDGEATTLVVGHAHRFVAELIAEPTGLLGVWLRIKRYFAAWPFIY